VFAISLLAALTVAVPHTAVVGTPWQATLRAAAQPTIVAAGARTTIRARAVRAGAAWRVTLRFPAGGSWRLRALVGRKTVQLGTVAVDVPRDPLLQDPIALAVDAAGALVVGQLRQSPLLRLTGARATPLADGPGGFFHLSRSGDAIYGAGRDGAVYRWDGGLSRVTGPVDAGSVAVDAAGLLYVTSYEAGTVRRIAPDGTIRTVATGLAHPHAVAIGGGHDLFIADTESRRIRRLDLATLELTTVGGDVGVTVYLAAAPDGSVYSVDVPRDGSGGGVTRTTADGRTTRVLSSPDVSAVAVAPDGTVYVVRWQSKRIDRLVGGRLEPVARG
jgi:hypothetical protein